MENALSSCVNLYTLTADEKRKIWLKRNGYTLKDLAKVAGMTVSGLSYRLRNSTMPEAQYQALVDFGMPPEFLPQPSLTTTDEKRKNWLKQNGYTMRDLAKVAGLTLSGLSRRLHNPTMPVAQHQALVQFGVPQELLPQPLDQKPGPRPRRPVAESSASLPA